MASEKVPSTPSGHYSLCLPSLNFWRDRVNVSWAGFPPLWGSEMTDCGFLIYGTGIRIRRKLMKTNGEKTSNIR